MAYPDANYLVKAWHGTDDDNSVDPNNYVTVVEDQNAGVEFVHRPVYTLTVTVVDGNGLFSVDPNANLVPDFVGSYVEDTTVTLRAEPNSNYYVEGWYDANTLVSVLKVHNVVMDSNHSYTLQFRQPDIISVGQGQGYDHTTIQAALADGSSGDDTIARSGDTIVVYEGTYEGGINFGGREDVKLASAAPEDAGIVANTVIDCGGSGRAFTFNHGEDANTLIDGFTIIKGSLSGEAGGAIYIGPNSSPKIAHIMISNCSVSGADGGAIYIGSNSNPAIGDVTIENSSVSGGNSRTVVGTAEWRAGTYWSVP